MSKDEIYKLIEANGLTLHGDIEHFAELVRAEALAEQPAQQEPEHIVHSNGRYSPLLTHMMNKRVESNIKQVIHLYDKPSPQPAQQEPVGKVTETINGAFKCEFSKPLPKGALLYTSPPAQRKPLTDEELIDVAFKSGLNGLNTHGYAFARAIETAHNIKENT